MNDGNRHAHGRRNNNTTRRGNSKSLFAPDASLASGGFFGPWREFPAKSIIDLTEEDLGDTIRYPGSWVFQINGRILQEGPAVAGERKVVPAVARIAFGSGAVQQQVEIDAWKGIIGIPAPVMRVSIFYTQIANFERTGFPNQYFPEVEFIATADRSLETGEGVPTRSYWVVPEAVQNTVVNVPVPPYAVSWCYIPQVIVPAGTTPVEARVFSNSQPGPNITIVDAPIPEVVASMMRTLCFRPLPPQAGFVELMFTDVVPSHAGQLVFRLSL